MFSTEVVNGVCPDCERPSVLISIERFFKCTRCGSELEQKVNGKISYIPCGNERHYLFSKGPHSWPTFLSGALVITIKEPPVNDQGGTLNTILSESLGGSLTGAKGVKIALF